MLTKINYAHKVFLGHNELTHGDLNKMANIEQFFIHSKAKLILITAWQRTGDKPLSKAMLTKINYAHKVFLGHNELTHGDLNKMANILQTFPDAFSWI